MDVFMKLTTSGALYGLTHKEAQPINKNAPVEWMY